MRVAQFLSPSVPLTLEKFAILRVLLLLAILKAALRLASRLPQKNMQMKC
jgi:hypothetical protein